MFENRRWDYNHALVAAVAQSVEQRIRNRSVALDSLDYKASNTRLRECQRRSRSDERTRFEQVSVFAGIAQLVEQRIRNAKVGGSTPLAGTT